MKKYLRWMLVATVVAAVVAGGYWWYENQEVSASTGDGTYTRTVTVTQGTLNGTVSVVGQLEAQESEALAFDEMSGTATLVTLAVEAGNTVTEGQVLATIDDAPYQQALDLAKSDLQVAEEELADLQTPATALEIAQSDVAETRAQVQLQEAQAGLDDLVDPDIASLQAAVASAKSAVAKAQAAVLAQQEDEDSKDRLADLKDAEADATGEYNRLAAETYWDEYYQDRLELAHNKMMDAQDARASYELSRQSSKLQAEAALRKAQVTLAEAQAALAEAQDGSDALELAQARLAVTEAQVNLELAQEARAELDEGVDATDLAAAQALVAAKKLAVSEAEAALAGTQLVAPFGGTVLETNVAAGDPVTASTVVLTVANLDTLEVAAAVDETTIREVSAGQAATITFDAYPGQSFGGEVQAVPLQGTLQGGVMVYSVPVSLAGAEELSLLVGMTANVEIAVAEATDAVLVPTIAVQETNGTYQVVMLDASGLGQAVTVEVGLSDGTYTQILSGLSAGDQVLVQTTANRSTATGGNAGSGLIANVSRMMGGQ